MRWCRLLRYLAFGASFSLIVLPAVLALLTAQGAPAAYSQIVVIVTALGLLALSAQLIWPRTNLTYVGVGATWLTVTVPYVLYSDSAWVLWAMCSLYLLAALMGRNLERFRNLASDPGFSEDVEMRLFLAELRAGLGGGIFMLMLLLSSALLLIVVAWLAFQSASLVIIAVLALCSLISITWLARGIG